MRTTPGTAHLALPGASPLTTIAATVAAVPIVAGGASAATLDRDPLFGTAQVVLDDGSVMPY